MNKPYLVQRALIQSVKNEAKLSNMVNLDYMGSAEFEFGALPDSLRTMHASKNNLTAHIALKVGQHTLTVYGAFSSKAEQDKYDSYLVEMLDGKLRCKEFPYFEIPKEKPKKPKYWGEGENRADFWWDVGNHVMWSFNIEFMKQLPKILQCSWDYMKLDPHLAENFLK